MACSRERTLYGLARQPFSEAGEPTFILQGEPPATIRQALALQGNGPAERVSRGTAHLPSGHRYHLTGNGITAAADALGFDTTSDFVQAYPVSLLWLASLCLRRMDAVCRLAATLCPGVDGLASQVEFHRRDRFGAVAALAALDSYPVRRGR